MPARFVERLAREGVPLEEVDLAYVDATRPQYLDAFGLPLEPFEYSKPAGKVLSHVVDLAGEPWGGRRPGRARLALAGLRGKGLLRLLVVSSLGCLGWSLSEFGQLGWAAAGAAAAAALGCDAWLGTFLRRGPNRGGAARPRTRP